MIGRFSNALLLASLALWGCSSRASTPSLPGPPSLPSPPALRPPVPPPAAGPAGETAGSGASEPEETAEPSKPAEPAGGAEDGAAASSSSPEAGKQDAGAQTRAEKQAVLDRKLRDSLSEFDELLERKQRRVAEERAARPAPGEVGSGEAAGGREGLGAEGSDLAEAPTSEASIESDEAEAAPGDREDVTPNGRVPADIPDGDDDDIVARQLREAAMEEDDPELREKLWQEYRDYKSGGRRKKEEAKG